MKTLATLTVIAALLPCAVQAAEPTAAEAAALGALAAATDSAWNAKDPAAMSAFYAPDATLAVAGAGEPRQGRVAIEAYFRSAFAQRVGELRHVTDLRSSELLGPGLALSDLTVRVEARQADGSWQVVRRFHNVSITRRDNDGWRLLAVRAYPVG